MFTGIITDIGRIARVENRGDLRIRIEGELDTSGIDLGASVACSGVCLTVVDKGEGWFAVDVSAETVARTAPKMWSAGRTVNLERPLRVGDELGGHIVTGHVDGVGRIVSVQPEGASTRIVIETDRALAPLVAEKGSVALDGVSLTVNEVEDDPAGAVRFGVNLIPHTARSTTFGAIEEGRGVNIEVDILARYLARMNRHANSM